MAKYKNLTIYFLLISIIIIHRYYWSTVSQWREDQGTNIWLAYTKTLSETPVGLLSSKMIPTPNGMLAFGKIFILFDSLLSVSFFLSLIQVIIFYFLSRELTSDSKINNYSFVLLSLSTLMSSSSVEFWNNWVLIIINGLFFIYILKYLNTKKSEHLLISIFISFVPPALYLAGLTNFIAYILIIFLALIINGNPKPVSRKAIVYTSALITLITNYLLIWKPYFKVITFGEIFQFSNLTLYDRFNLFTDSLLQLPGSFLTIWTNQKSFYILQVDRDVISELTNTLFKLYVEYHKILFLMFFLLLIFGVSSLTKISNIDLDKLLIKKLILFINFVLISVLINPILGGPNYFLLERMENMAQYYIFYILVVFLLPFIFIKFKFFKEKLIPLNKSIFLIFIVLNLVLSFNIISNSLNYEGEKLTEADIPLLYKIELIDFIGNHAQSKLNRNSISVSYVLGGGIWDWVPNHSEYFSKWYDDYPFTIGRTFDYQLLRKYSINNIYEGLNSRDFNNSDYVITYKFDKHQILNNKQYNHIYFGQLRLSVKE